MDGVERVRHVGQAAVGACLCVCLAGAAWARPIDLAGTRRGPTGWYLTAKERDALRQRVKAQPWAKSCFERQVVPDARRGDPWACAVAYVVTGDKRYLDTARGWLLFRIRQWHAFPEEKRYATDYKLPGGWAWGMQDGDWYVEVYDLIADGLNDEDERACRRHIKDCCDTARRWHQHTTCNPNMKMNSLPALLRWACAIGYDDCVRWTLDVKEPETRWLGGLLSIMNQYLRDGKIGVESPVYHTISIAGAISVAETLRRYRNEDFYARTLAHGGTVRDFLDGLIETAYPLERTGIGRGSVRVANWGHGSTDWGTATGDLFLVNSPGAKRFSPQDSVRKLFRRHPDDPRYRWLLSLVPEAQEPDRDDFLYGRVRVPKQAPPPAVTSRLFPASGIAMLRRPVGPDYWRRGIGVFVHGGEVSRGHIADPMIMLHGAGRLLHPEWCAIQYESPVNIGWTSRRVSANTIVIDGRDGMHSYTTYRWGFDPGLTPGESPGAKYPESPGAEFVAMRCHPYMEAVMERALALTDTYLLDVFWAKVLPGAVGQEHFPGVGSSVYWSGNASLSEDQIIHLGQERNFFGTSRQKVYGPRRMPASHTFDYMLHGLGRQAPDVATRYVPSREFTTSYWPNRWTLDERRRVTGGAFHVDWVQTCAGLRRRYPPWINQYVWRDLWRRMGDAWFSDRAGVRMHMLGEPGTTVHLGSGPMRWGPVDTKLYPEEAVPFVAVRRRGKEALYVALHEPYKDRPRITGFEYIHRARHGAAHPSVGVKVTGPGFVDRVFVTLNVGGQRFDAKRSTWGPSGPSPLVLLVGGSEEIAFRSHAYLRHAGRRITVRGDVAYFRIRATDVPPDGALTVNGRPVSYQVSDGHVVYGRRDPEWRAVGGAPRQAPIKTPSAAPVAPRPTKPERAVVTEVKETYTDRVERMKKQVDIYDHYLVRAPGYTIRIDKSSGVSRWIADPDGHVRTSLGGYPFLKTRGRIPYVPAATATSLPTVWGRGHKAVFGWDVPATCEGVGTDGPGGHPTLTFRSADGTCTLRWVFGPDAIRVTCAQPKKTYAKVDLSRLDVEEPGYRYRLVPKGDRIGFRLDNPLVPPWPERRPPNPAAKPVKLDINGDFAKLSPNPKHPSGTFPTGWDVVHNDNWGLVGIDPRQFVTGGRSLRFDLSKMRTAKHWIHSLWLRRRGIPVKACRRYRLTLRLRHEHVRGVEPRHVLAVQYAAPGLAGELSQTRYNPAFWPGGTRDWFDNVHDIPWAIIGARHKPIAADGKLDIAVLLPAFKDQSGVVWIDELVVEELPPG